MYRHISFELNALAFSTRIYSRDNANVHFFLQAYIQKRVSIFKSNANLMDDYCLPITEADVRKVNFTFQKNTRLQDLGWPF